jgi:lipopolysaccharide transport system ATP-binding protein
VLAGVTAPTSGTFAVKGRIAALIDALVGFHPDLTGRENVFLLASMHGVPRKRIAPRVDDILEFAEIREMADTPVKRYSAGMSARLGFGVITALEPEILLVDEVLAVGDATFQRKCISWLDEYRSSGGTLLFVSHNLALVRHMTRRVVWLDHGKVVADGATDSTLAEYARAMERRESTHLTRSRRDVRKEMAASSAERWGAGGARVDEVHIEERPGEGVEIAISFSTEDPAHEDVVCCVGFVDESGREIGAAASPPLAFTESGGFVRCAIDPLPFRSGIYFPIVAILSSDGLIRDRWRVDRAVVVNGQATTLSDFGPVDIRAAWSGERATQSENGDGHG